MSPQQLEAGIPIVVPTSFTFERINLLWGGPPTAVVLDRGLQSTAVTPGDIPNHAVDIEEQELAGGGWVVQKLG